MAKLSPIYFNQQLFIVPFLKLTQSFEVSMSLRNFKEIIFVSIDRIRVIKEK